MTGLRRDLVAAALLAMAAWIGPAAAARWARPALLNFGPNDADYVRGFRQDWERDGRTRFHWTSPAASVTLPLRLRGEGFLLRMRLRRHFVEPAHVRLAVEGRTVSTFDIQADTKVPYRVVEVQLPPLEGRHDFVLGIEAPSENPRPLGIALDWMEIERRGSAARFVPKHSLAVALVAVALAAFVAPRLAGAPLLPSLSHAAALLLGAAAGIRMDILAAERILREGAPAYLGVALLGLALARWRRAREGLGLASPALAGGVVIALLVAVAIRLLLLLHPQFYYPDVKVHALFAWQLVSRGFLGFMEHFTENQYRFSLGLQFENGHWYAFPYPPAFYVLTWPLVRLAHYRPEVAVCVLGAVVNSLETFLIFALARRLGADGRMALVATSLQPLLPIFLARLTLAYFPALVGHFVDAAVLLYLLARWSHLDRPRVVVSLGLLVAGALLTYTQSLLNLGIILPLFLLTQVVRDREPGARRRQAGLLVGGVLGVLLSLVFYGRYVPVFLDMRRGVPMAEEQILLDKMEAERRRPDFEEPVHDVDDPFAQPSLDLWRGVRKAAWRLWVFYGVFAPLVVAGVLMHLRHLSGAPARLAAVWASTYLLLNLASGGLPGPNLVRYNKDLEIVAPLVCVGLAWLGVWLWERARLAALACAAAWVVFGSLRAAGYLTEKFVLER